MTTRKIFFASLVIGTLAIQAATANAQSRARGASLPQNEELRVIPAVAEDTCRLSASEDESGRGYPRTGAPQMKGAWILSFTPNSEDSPPFSSLATFSSDGLVINTAAGVTYDGGVINGQDGLANRQRPAFQPECFYPRDSSSPGIGAWVTQNVEVLITLAHLLYDGWGHRIGVAKVRASLKIYGGAADTFSGRYVTEIFNNDGDPMRTLNGTVMGQRIFVEKLPVND